MTRILTEDEIEENFTIDACIDALSVMFQEMGRENAITNSRQDIFTPVSEPPDETSGIVYHKTKTMSGSIPAFNVSAIRLSSDILDFRHKQESDSIVTKKIHAVEGNRSTGLVLLFSTETGEPLMIYQDGMVQSYRVAGTSALGAKYLGPETATTLGILGAGQQARHHLLAHDELQNLDTVKVYSPTPESREEYASEMDDRVNPTVRAVDTPEAVFDAADIVQTATNSLSPVFEVDWLEPGTHIGTLRPTEVPMEYYDIENFDAMAQSWSTITETQELARQHKEHVIPTKDVKHYVIEGQEPVPRLSEVETSEESTADWHQIPGLGEVMLEDSLGRRDPDDVTAFYNRGMGIQFAAAGKALHDVAQEKDLGQILPLEMFTQSKYKS